MSEPRQTVCSPWATLEDAERLRGTAVSELPNLDAMLEVASDLLFAASGYRWPGLCTDTVRPCGRVTGTDSPAWHGSVATTPVMWTWQPSWGFCSCNRPLSRACGCDGPSEITLGASPIVSIEKVTENGVDLDEGLYTVDDWRWLVRLRDPDGTRRSWRCCQDMTKPLTEEGTWGVEFTYGASPPPAGVLACVDLATELLRANSGEDCALPPRVTSMIRQGVQVALIDPMAIVAAGGFGVYSVDTFLGRLPKHRASSVHVPGRGGGVRRRTG